ncbi:serine protease (plasmid) [Rhizobium leguminosarum]
MPSPRRCFLLLTLASLTLSFLTQAAAQEVIKLGGDRIVGGKHTTIKDNPWQVALIVEREDGFSYLCGGSIVAQKWVLTAAHCFGPDPKKSTAVAVAGATDFGPEWRAGHGIGADLIIAHEGYHPGTHENDIALVKLKSPPNGEVIPIASPSLAIPVGEGLTVTGWGATREGGDPTNDLLIAKVNYTDPAVCNAPQSYNKMISDSMICAGFPDGRVDACQGDSGGPLVWMTPDQVHVLVGVVSIGEGCARKLKYGVYSRVSSYNAWIHATMAANGM